VNINTFNPDIRQHKCRTCKDVLMESGYLRFHDTKEIRMVGTWKKENYGIHTISHPLRPGKIICIDVHCICNKCGSKNIIMVATGLDDKSKIKIKYNKLEQAAGRLYG
jgi:hypothetical protein